MEHETAVTISFKVCSWHQWKFAGNFDEKLLYYLDFEFLKDFCRKKDTYILEKHFSGFYSFLYGVNDYIIIEK